MNIFAGKEGVLRLLILGFAIVMVFSANSFAEFDSIPGMVQIRHSYKSGDNPFLLPIWSPIYELDGNSFLEDAPADNAKMIETTLYEPYNANTQGWWDNIFEEMKHGGVHATLLLTRSWESSGPPWEPIDNHLVKAMERTGMDTLMKIGQFDDCGAWRRAYKQATGNETIDWGNSKVIDYIMWDLCLKRFHDAIPKRMWLRYDGKPLVVFWGGVRNNKNGHGNISGVIKRARKKFKERYGEDLFIVVHKDWVSEKYGDPTILTDGETDAINPWFGVPNDTLKGCDFRTYNDYTVGAAVPGFRKYNQDKNSKDYGKPIEHHATFDRDHGNEIRNSISYMHKLDANFLICEAWVNQRESAGFYRSGHKHWDYPNQYINIVHETNDSETKSRRFQAEGCDFFNDKTAKNEGGDFSRRALDVKAFSDKGWYVGWVAAGEWLEWKEPYFKDSLYDVYLKYASNRADNRVVLQIGDSSEIISLPATGGAKEFKGKKILTEMRMNGRKDIKLIFLTPDISVDFLHFDQVVGTSVIVSGDKVPGSIHSRVTAAVKGSNIVANFQLAQPTDVKLAIYNNLGQQVVKSLTKRVDAGVSSLSIPHNLASGIYHMKATVNNEVVSNTIVIDANK